MVVKRVFCDNFTRADVSIYLRYGTTIHSNYYNSSFQNTPYCNPSSRVIMSVSLPYKRMRLEHYNFSKHIKPSASCVLLVSEWGNYWSALCYVGIKEMSCPILPPNLVILRRDFRLANNHFLRAEQSVVGSTRFLLAHTTILNGADSWRSLQSPDS